VFKYLYLNDAWYPLSLVPRVISGVSALRSGVACYAPTIIRRALPRFIWVNSYNLRTTVTQMNIIERDLKHIWHPCSQMKDYEGFPPLEIVGAKGSYLHLADGRKVIDAISSWWCKSLGHNHPRLKQALLEQVEKFEHVILANTTNETIVRLSEKLSHLTNTLDKVFYASDGSCAIEIAIKMSLHSHQLQGETGRTKLMALANGYHGETCVALGVSDVGIYRDAYEALLPDVTFIKDLPYVQTTEDPLWDDCSEYWPNVEAQLNQHAQDATALLFEPILQGAGGMMIYSKDLLVRLRKWATQHNVHLIADEIMTGFGRTGLTLACQHANIEPDFLCLSKGLTSGWLPMSAVLTSTTIYEQFYDDYEKGKNFLHSHTYTGNALAAAVALATMEVMEEENIVHQVQNNHSILLNNMLDVSEKTGLLRNVRGIGFMVAADLITDQPRAGFEVYKKAVKLGALLRPLGNTLYWMPPLNSPVSVLNELRDVTLKSLS